MSRTLHSLREGRPTATYLEIGCGDQRYRKYLDEQAWACTFTDVEFRSERVSALADAQQLPFANEVFDIIVMTEVLEHIPDVNSALLEISRTLKPNGMLVVTFPFNYGLHEVPYDFRRWTEFNAIRHFADVGLVTREFERRGDAVAVLLTIATQLVTGGLEALKRKAILKPLYYLAMPIVFGLNASAIHAYLLIWQRLFKTQPCYAAGEGLKGLKGHLNLWHLGYQFVCQKIS